MVTVLRQIRDGYTNRPQSFPHSLALVGLRDVRDYKVASGGTDRVGTSSPFNIKADSITLRNFTRDEIAALYGQHTGQVFAPEAVDRAFALTQGQPWLVNALARQLTQVLVRDRAKPIDAANVDEAREILIRRQDTHLDSLIERLREPRVRAIIEPMLAGETLGEVSEDLHRVVNGGSIEREYAIGRGRMDLCLRYAGETLAIEIKVWRPGRPDPQAAGLAQFDGYLAGLGLDSGWLVIFDRRPGLPPVEERLTSSEETSPAGNRVTVIRL